MARVVALLRDARVAGLVVHLAGDVLVLRGPASLDRRARQLLELKPLLRAVLEHEDECVGHQLYAHFGRDVDWWCRPDGGPLCAVCHPPGPTQGAADA